MHATTWPPLHTRPFPCFHGTGTVQYGWYYGTMPMMVWVQTAHVPCQGFMMCPEHDAPGNTTGSLRCIPSQQHTGCSQAHAWNKNTWPESGLVLGTMDQPWDGMPGPEPWRARISLTRAWAKLTFVCYLAMGNTYLQPRRRPGGQAQSPKIPLLSTIAA